jgi:hypothetical protein
LPISNTANCWKISEKITSKISNLKVSDYRNNPSGLSLGSKLKFCREMIAAKNLVRS